MVGKTEVEVIRDWFINIFMPIEKTADIVVTDFKFEQLNHLRAHYQHHHSARNRSNRSADPGVESDGKRSFEKKMIKINPKIIKKNSPNFRI